MTIRMIGKRVGVWILGLLLINVAIPSGSGAPASPEPATELGVASSEGGIGWAQCGLTICVGVVVASAGGCVKGQGTVFGDSKDFEVCATGFGSAAASSAMVLASAHVFAETSSSEYGGDDLEERIDDATNPDGASDDGPYIPILGFGEIHTCTEMEVRGVPTIPIEDAMVIVCSSGSGITLSDGCGGVKAEAAARNEAESLALGPVAQGGCSSGASASDTVLLSDLPSTTQEELRAMLRHGFVEPLRDVGCPSSSGRIGHQQICHVLEQQVDEQLSHLDGPVEFEEL